MQYELAKKLFKTDPSSKPAISKYTPKYYEGLEYFKIASNLNIEAVSNKPMHRGRKEQKDTAALEFCDKAVENGYDETDVYVLRAMCLRSLNYDLEAIEDLNKCVEREPANASLYYHRAITKQYMYDYEGSLADFEEAIRLSKLDNDDTRFWNEYAIKSGYKSATQKYEYDFWILRDDIRMAEQYESAKLRIKGMKHKRRFE